MRQTLMSGHRWGVPRSLKSDSRCEGMERIGLVPIGDVHGNIIESLVPPLRKLFRASVEVTSPLPHPDYAYNPRRRQYHSSTILRRLRALRRRGFHRVLGVADLDLYVPSLNFVFGEADLGGGTAVIALARLHQSFYGLPENPKLFLQRALKEAVHELGHTYGLTHCRNPLCVMFFSNSLADTDRKQASFCERCQSAFR
ncbi:MAG: archaemetzincin family Zn-dependent metalloprotease [bacterium]